MIRAFLTSLLSIVLLAACAGGDSTGASPSTADPGEEAAPAPAPPTASDGTVIALPGATFELPSAWQQEAPSSSMRAAQAQIPGDDGNGQLTVFFFGAGGGGGVEANLQRWIGQVEVDPANPPIRETFSGAGTNVSWVEARGTLKPSTMGTGPTSPQPNSMLLGAVVEGNGGPWYFKATGPATTLDAHKDAFLAMLGSVRPGGGA